MPYDSYQNAILDLKNGRLDAVFGDTAVVNEWLKKNPELAPLGEKVTDKSYFGSGLGIAVRQGTASCRVNSTRRWTKLKPTAATKPSTVNGSSSNQ